MMLEGDWIQHLKQFNLADACDILADAWKEISNSVLVQSWKPLLAGFEQYDELCKVSAVANMDVAVDLALDHLQILLKKKGVELPKLSIIEWIKSIDPQSCEHLNDDDILQLVRGDKVEQNPQIDSLALDSNLEGCSDTEEPPTTTEQASEGMSNNQIDQAFCVLTEYYKTTDQTVKLLNIKKWREEFLDSVTLGD